MKKILVPTKYMSPCSRDRLGLFAEHPLREITMAMLYPEKYYLYEKVKKDTSLKIPEHLKKYAKEPRDISYKMIDPAVALEKFDNGTCNDFACSMLKYEGVVKESAFRHCYDGFRFSFDEPLAVSMYEKYGEKFLKNVRIVEVPDGIDWEIYSFDKEEAPVVLSVLSRNGSGSRNPRTEKRGFKRVIVMSSGNYMSDDSMYGIRLSCLGDVIYAYRSGKPIFLYSRDWVLEEADKAGVPRKSINEYTAPYHRASEKIIAEAIAECTEHGYELRGYLRYSWKDLGDQVDRVADPEYLENYFDRSDPVILGFFDNKEKEMFVFPKAKYRVEKIPEGASYVVFRKELGDPEIVVTYDNVYK
jgi:hypothetical protein